MGNRALTGLWLAIFIGLMGAITIGRPAQARIVDTFQLGAWSASAFTNDETGAFDTCVASAAYANGITMYVQVDAMYDWALGFSAPTWRMTPGIEIPLQYKFDRGQWQQGVATAASETLARMQMPSDGYIVTRFRRSNVMYVYDGSYTYDFRLTGTSRLMQRMVKCVQTNVARFPGGQAMTGLGQSSMGQPASAPAQSDPALALEATQALFNIMSQAGLALTMIPDGQREEPDLNGVHAVATAGRRLLVTHIFPAGAYESDQTVMSGLVADSAEACEGRFASGSERIQQNGVPLLTGSAVCEAGDVETIERIVLAPRSAGGLFVFGVRDTEVGEGGGPVDPLPPLSDETWYRATAVASQ